MEQALIAAGVKSLQEYGYPAVDKTNILTDPIYSGFFRSMLRDTKGHSPEVDKAIDSLLAKIVA